MTRQRAEAAALASRSGSETRCRFLPGTESCRNRAKQ
ncbi:unnamed protein product, partial [Ixodes pacificus]